MEDGMGSACQNTAVLFSTSLNLCIEDHEFNYV